MSELRTNCIGYAYQETGLVDRERFITVPKLDEILELFKRVENAKMADLVAVIIPGPYGKEVAHLAVINEDKKTVRHRKGVNRPLSQGLIENEIAHYEIRPYSEIVYLAKKIGS